MKAEKVAWPGPKSDFSQIDMERFAEMLGFKKGVDRTISASCSDTQEIKLATWPRQYVEKIIWHTFLKNSCDDKNFDKYQFPIPLLAIEVILHTLAPGEARIPETSYGRRFYRILRYEILSDKEFNEHMLAGYDSEKLFFVLARWCGKAKKLKTIEEVATSLKNGFDTKSDFMQNASIDIRVTREGACDYILRKKEARAVTA